MQLDQFEKLERLAKKTIDLVYELKFENQKLKKENSTLKNQIENLSDAVPSDLLEQVNSLKKENFELRDRHLKISSRLSTVLKKVRGLSEGVEL